MEELKQHAMRQFSLLRHPFMDGCQSSSEVYYSADHNYIKSAMQQAARTMGCLYAVVGESGSGKTTVKEDFLRWLEAERVVAIESPYLEMKEKTAAQIIARIIETLSPTARLRRNREAREVQLIELLRSYAKAGNKCLLLIEEAQDGQEEVLKLLKRLVEIKYNGKSCMSVVMIGQPEFLIRLDPARNPHLRELGNRTVSAILEPLADAAEVKDYLALKFDKPADIFSFDAYDALLESLSELKDGKKKSGAYPQALNEKVVKVLNAASELGLDQINAELVHSVA